MGHQTLPSTNPGTIPQQMYSNHMWYKSPALSNAQNVHKKYPRMTGYSSYRQDLLHTTAALSPPCCIHGPVSAPVPSTFTPSGQIAGNENYTWTKDHHIVDLDTLPRTNWASHGRVRRKDGGVDTKDSKFYLCHTS